MRNHKDYPEPQTTARFLLSITMNKNASEKCNSMLELAVSKNKNIHTIIDAIEALGCSIPKDFIACR